MDQEINCLGSSGKVNQEISGQEISGKNNKKVYSLGISKVRELNTNV